MPNAWSRRILAQMPAATGPLVETAATPLPPRRACPDDASGAPSVADFSCDCFYESSLDWGPRR